jgi:hypothetical protein
VVLNEAPAPQYDLIADLLHVDMFKVFSDMLLIETLRIQQDKSSKFGYLSMMSVTTLGALNAELFCERVLSCVKLVVSDLTCEAFRGLKVQGLKAEEMSDLTREAFRGLKAEEILMLVMIRMNHEFIEYMRVSHPNTPLSEFKVPDTHVHSHGGVKTLEDDENDE